MSDIATSVPFPTADQPETSYTARTGQTVSLRYVDTDVAEVRLGNHPTYAAHLTRTGADFFDLEPARGVAAVGGQNISGQDLIDFF
jgi:hypothetical protein